MIGVCHWVWLGFFERLKACYVKLVTVVRKAISIGRRCSGDETWDLG